MSLHVHVISGATERYEEDLVRPGLIPVRVARLYDSSHPGVGGCGTGWMLNLALTLTVTDTHVTLRTPGAPDVVFSPIQEGVTAVQEGSGYVLDHYADRYEVVRAPGYRLLFPKHLAGSGVHPLARIEDRAGNHVQLGYRGRTLTEVADTVGRLIHLRRSGDLLTALEVTPPGGGAARQVRTYAYNARGYLIRVTDAIGAETRYQYDGGVLVGYTNRVGGVTYAQYNDDRQCIACWQSNDARVRRMAYDDRQQLTRVIDSTGQQHLYQHAGGTFVLKQVFPDGTEQLYYYDELHRLIGYAAADGRVETFQRHDAEERTFQQIDGEARMATVLLSDTGRATEVADGAGHAFTLTYDESGFSTGLKTPVGHAWQWTRDNRGRLTSLESPEGRTAGWVWDGGAGCTVTDGDGSQTHVRYDNAGRIVEVTRAEEAVHAFTYDAEGRLTDVTPPDGAALRFAHDGEGHLTAVSDTRDRREALRYDAFGQCTSYASGAARWQFAYDSEGRLVNVQDGVGTTYALAYMADGRLQTVRADGTAWASVAYAEDGLVEIDSPSGHYAARYNGVGQVLEEHSPHGVRSLAYTPSGALAGARVNGDARQLTYTADGQVRTVSAGAEDLSFQHDRDGVLQGVHVGGTRALTLAVDGAGRLQTLAVDGAGLFQYRHDALGRLEEVTDGGGATLATVAYVSDRGMLRVPGKGQVDEAELADATLPNSATVHLQLTTIGAQVVSRLVYGGLALPVWVHGALPHRAPPLPQAMARACSFRTVDPLQKSAMPALQTYERWLRTLTTRCQLTGLPAGVLPSWGQPLATSYVLHPGAQDPVGGHDRPLQPLRPPADLRRSPDLVMTGPHQRDALWPTAWPDRATYLEPLVPAGIVRRGGPTPREMLKWIDREGS
ncbi:MAG: hypothetical protein GVY12_05195 [Bacteroidetes bacterium]|jgi:YD repeat-containing protein|nr:hypothetical protein [Bacteroidota bacterium]